MNPSAASASKRRFPIEWVLAGWFVVAAIMGAQTMAPHLLPFRAPEASSPRDAALAALRPEGAPRASWTAVHVFYGACACSGRILDHLATSPRPAGFVEVILWVGDSKPGLATVEARGFRVVHVEVEELARTFHVESVPLLVAIDPAGKTHYAGGYTARKQGPAILDVEILAQAREALRGRGGAPAALPLFGCGVSDRLREALDLFDARGGS